MGAGVFGPEYASLYDNVYAQKDYAQECRVIAALIKEYGAADAASILDLGCGTGGHAVALAQRGFGVVGLDRSPEMVLIAKQKAQDAGVAVDVREGDLLSYDLGQTFDAALMMFAVLGYQHGNDEVKTALTRARAHLEPGGVLIFDVWFGPAVLHQRPETRVATIDADGGEILRISSATLDVRSHLSDVDIRMVRLSGNHIEADTHEIHRMRFFFEPELRLFLEIAGFELVSLSAFPDPTVAPSLDTWNVLAVARALA